MSATWVKGTDLLVILEEFQNARDGSNLLDKTVTFTAYDDEDDSVLAADVAMDYYAASGSDPHYYAGTLADTTPNVEEGMTVKIVINGNGGAGLQHKDTDRVKVISGDE